MDNMTLFVYVGSNELGVSAPFTRKEAIEFIDKRVRRYDIHDQIRILFTLNFILQSESIDMLRKWQNEMVLKITKGKRQAKYAEKAAVFTRWGILFLLQRALLSLNPSSTENRRKLLPSTPITSFTKENFYDPEFRRYIISFVAINNALMNEKSIIRTIMRERFTPFETTLLALHRSIFMYGDILDSNKNIPEIAQYAKHIEKVTHDGLDIKNTIVATGMLVNFFQFPPAYNQRKIGIDLSREETYTFLEESFHGHPAIITLLHRYSIGLENIRESINSLNVNTESTEISAYENYGLFFEFPFVRTSFGKYVLIDTQFLADKFVYGLPLLVNKSLGIDKGNDSAKVAFAGHGRLLECYFRGIMCSFFKVEWDESMGTGEDFRLEYGNSVALFELTKEYIRADMMYSLDEQLFMAKLEKMLFGDKTIGGKRAKGKLTQLNDYILRNRDKKCIGILVTERYLGNVNMYISGQDSQKNWVHEKCKEYGLEAFIDNPPIFTTFDDFDQINYRYLGTKKELIDSMFEYQKSLNPFLYDFLNENGKMKSALDAAKSVAYIFK